MPAPSDPICCYIGIGSNIDSPYGNPIETLQSAVSMLSDSHGISIKACSSCYQSAPYGPIRQNDYINAVISIDCKINAHALLHLLHTIEKKHGRNRAKEVRWGPRTLDLDILLFGNMIINDKNLTIPHPEMDKREFVILPLLEIEPELILPNNKSIKAASKNLKNKKLEKLDLNLCQNMRA